jgi:small subunit ribosomal protein S2
MRQITLEELLEAGCHFGHQVNRRNPKANRYIFEARSGVNIINLESTQEGLIVAAEYVKSLAERGGSIVVVGTKRQAQQIVKEEVERAREVTPDTIHYIISRWIGGIFTNFDEVRKNFKRLVDYEKIINSEDRGGYTKREAGIFEKELIKLKDIYGGLYTIKQAPDAVFIIDTHGENTAVREAERVGLTTIGITDTNADPSEVTYAIPANDDAVGSIKLITSYLIDAWIEGSKEKMKSDNKAAEKAAKEAAELKKTKEKEAAKTAVV